MNYSKAAACAAALVGVGALPMSAHAARGISLESPSPQDAADQSQAITPIVLGGGLSLAEALEVAIAHSPSLAAEQAEVEAARGRLRQARFRINPELNLEVENFAGTGPYSGFNGTETTVSINQQLDLAGRRRARMTLGEAELAAQQLRFAIARAELVQQVRTQFANGVAARERLALADDNVARAQELARIARELVDAGREPPLRALRADAALAQANAALSAARADEEAARRSLAALIGSDSVPAALVGDGSLPGPIPSPVAAERTLDAQLAQAERVINAARLKQARAEGRINPSVGVGVREIRETGDRAFVASISVPLPLFDRNQGNIAAARSSVQAAGARRQAVLDRTRAEIANARSELAAAEARVAALETSGISEAREALRLANLSYRAGKSSLLELLDAQRAFALTQSELIEARRARAEAEARLARQAATAQ